MGFAIDSYLLQTLGLMFHLSLILAQHLFSGHSKSSHLSKKALTITTTHLGHAACVFVLLKAYY